MSFPDLDLISDPLPTVCSSDGDIVDETKATRCIFPAVMARRSNSDKGSPRRVRRSRGEGFHDGVNRFAYCTESTLNRVY